MRTDVGSKRFVKSQIKSLSATENIQEKKKEKKNDLCFPCHTALENRMTQSIQSFALQ